MSQPNPNMTYEELREQVKRTKAVSWFDHTIQDELADELIQLFATLGAEVTEALPYEQNHPSVSDPTEAEKVIAHFDAGWNEYRRAAKKAVTTRLAQLTTKNTEEENV